MEKSLLDHLMDRYVRGEVTKAERAKIEAWLDAMGAEDNTDLELSKEEEDRIFRKLTSTVMAGEDITIPKRTRSRPDRWILQIAASLLIVSTLSYVIWQFVAPDPSHPEVVSAGRVEKVILNDGSLVWLRGQSKVVYQEKPDEGTRYAVFEGEEALFEVSKDADRPFIVACGDARIKVLGTSFSVRATKDIVEVTVLTGSVNLSSSANADGIDLVMHEKAICRLDGTFEKLETRRSDITTLTEDTDYDMHFESANMGDVLRRLEGKFNVTVKLSDPAIRACRITIDLTDTSLDNSLRLVSEVLGLTYTVDRGTVNISGQGCD